MTAANDFPICGQNFAAGRQAFAQNTTGTWCISIGNYAGAHTVRATACVVLGDHVDLPTDSDHVLRYRTKTGKVIERRLDRITPEIGRMIIGEAERVMATFEYPLGYPEESIRTEGDRFRNFDWQGFFDEWNRNCGRQ